MQFTPKSKGIDFGSQLELAEDGEVSFERKCGTALVGSITLR